MQHAAIVCDCYVRKYSSTRSEHRATSKQHPIWLQHRSATHQPGCRQRTVTALAAALAGSSIRVLPDGTAVQFFREQPTAGGGRPPLLFLHGSGHAAWCWKERFTPFFAERGFDSYALSFRGQGGSTVPPSAKPATLESNAADVADFVATLSAPPVVIAHSFGGLVLQKYVEKMAGRKWPALAGTAFLASAPHTGNSELVKRIMRAMPLKAVAITWGFITKSYSRSTPAAKRMFFSDDIPDADMNRYGELFRANPGAVRLVDVQTLKEELPITFPKQRPPAYVAGGDADCIVDVQAVQELAAELGVEPVIHRSTAHDLMLDTRWQEVAEHLEAWLQTL